MVGRILVLDQKSNFLLDGEAVRGVPRCFLGAAGGASLEQFVPRLRKSSTQWSGAHAVLLTFKWCVPEQAYASKNNENLPSLSPLINQTHTAIIAITPTSYM